MIAMKIILVIFLLVILRAFLVQKLVLFKRVIAFLMFLFLLLLVLFPEVSTAIANAVGVSRGVDFLFYLSHLFLLFLVVGLWRRSVVLMTTITKLSRAIALQSPNKPHEGDNKVGGKAK